MTLWLPTTAKPFGGGLHPLQTFLHAVDAALHAIGATLHAIAPVEAVVMRPAAHSTTPYQKTEDDEANRPTQDEAQDRQRDPTRSAEFVDAINEGHRGTM